jgi:DNA-binding response OmpR family regulator
MTRESAVIDIPLRLPSAASAASAARIETHFAACAAARPAGVDACDPAGAGPILVVDSDVAVAGALVEQFKTDGYSAEFAGSAEHARMLAGRYPPRLAVLGGLDSPRGSLELLEEIREAARGRASWVREMPVIVVGASASELDMLRAFEAGADDFVPHPLRYLELRARMRALLRRVERMGVPAHRVAVGPLEIDMDGHGVSLHGLPVDLRRLEFELLVHLAGDPERVFGKQELLRTVWGYRSSGSTRTVDSHASRLRRKLQERGGRWVINVWGVGYRLR